MSSVITTRERGGVCLVCGHNEFNHVIHDKRLKIKIPVCKKCGRSELSAIRIRRSLPVGEDGKAGRVEVTFNRTGQKIESVEEALFVARAIDYDIQSGRFDPNDYKPKAKQADLIFENYINNKYWPAQERKLKKGELSPAGLKIKRSAKAHLLKAFGGIDIRRITQGPIFDFYESFEGGDGARRLAIQELQVILRHALNSEKITKLPEFPSIKKPKLRDVEKFLTDEEQEKIISAIDDPLYKAMIEVLVIYAMRPCELRALQWRDLDFHSGVITIQRHFSNGTYLKIGRKSNEAVHYLPMTPRFLEIVRLIPHSIRSEDFVFKGKEGGAVADRGMARHWNKACKKLGINNVELYEGTKHSRLSFLKKQGFSDDQLLHLSGHTNVETLKRYAQITKLNKLDLVREMIQ